MLHKIIATVSTETESYRLWLDVFPENTRARRAYEAVGFVAEGIARGNLFFADTQRDQVIMSIIRPDWVA